MKAHVDVFRVAGVFLHVCKQLFSMRILNVAEKNDAAKNIAEILSGGRLNRREGLSKFNKIYEFGLCLGGVHTNMIMTSVSGHLQNYEFPPSFKSWHATDPLILFDSPVDKYVMKDGEPIKQTLQREIRSCEKLIIWTDCDREGENIGVEVIRVCQEVKPNIEVLRAKFSEITPTAIHRAIEQLTVPDYRVSDAVDARQELDLRIGAAFTRFQTLRLRRVFPTVLSNQLISYGSCQFPTLGFVVERFREVDRFIPEPFWRIVITAERDGKAVDFQWRRGRLFDQDCCRAYYEHILENRYGQIVEVTKHPKSKWRPVAMHTVELEKLATRKLRIGAKAAMHLAERLYTQGYISYPRTETNIFPANMDLAGLVRTQTQDNRWAAFASRVLESGIRPRNGKSTDKAHPPIHPLKLGSNLQGDEARLYELVTRHFLACVSADAQGAETVVRLCVGKPSIPGPQPGAQVSLLSPEDGEMFEAKGLVILQPNYLDVYIYDRWVERDMPSFTLGDWILPINIEMVSGQTSPPPLLTEADLISLMDRHGIGTDSTHADHIETIKQRLYVGLEQAKFLVPGQLGMGLVEGYDAMGFDMSKPYLRAELEADLRLICDGHKTKDEVLRHHLTKYRNLFQRVVASATLLDQSLAVRLEQTAEDVSTLPGSVGETFSFIGPQQAAASQNIASCPSCSRAVTLRQRRTQTQQPLSEISHNGPPSGSPGEHFDSARPTSWFLSCSGYPLCCYAVWFPDSVLNVRVACGPDGPLHCSRCSSIYAPSTHGSERAPGPLKLAFRLRRNLRLPNGYCQDDPNKEYVTCVFCDHDMQNALGIRINVVPPSTNQRSAQPSSPRISGPPAPTRPSAVRRLSPARRLPSHPSTPFSSSTSSGSRSFTSAAGSVVSSMVPNHVASSFPSLVDFQPSTMNRDLSTVGESDQDAIVCNCGVQALLLTVKKVGPNQGRLFYRCGGGSASSCDFFQWKTPTDSLGPLASSTQTPQLMPPSGDRQSWRSSWSPAPTGHPNVGPQSTYDGGPGTSSGFGTSTSGGTVMLCRCGDPAKLLRVTKATANQGREFYACPNSRPGPDTDSSTGCNFFLWADSVAGSQPPTGWHSSTNPQSSSRGRRHGRSGGSTSAESGVSLGHVSMWPPPASSGLRGSISNTGRRCPLGSTRTRVRSGQSNTRRCGLCGETGHTRPRCPRNNTLN